MRGQPLAGFTIGVTADRRAAEQIKLLEGRGASCFHGPVIKTHPLSSADDVRSSTETLLAAPPDLAVLTTGLGVRGWLEAADSVRLGDDLRRLLAATTLYARGPKAVGAAVTAGFDVAWNAPTARYDDIVAALAERGVTGSRVAVQLDGAGAVGLCEAIETLGAEVVRIPVYRWSLPDDLAPAERLLRAVIERRVDAVTFTAKPAVENFFEIAGLLGVGDQVVDAMSGDVAPFCVGPVCATGFAGTGVTDPFVPDRHRLGAMVQQLASYFGGRGTDVRLGGADVRVQGRLALVDGTAAWLTDRERALLAVLLESPGVVRSKRELLRRVWNGTERDEHLVEVTVARLRTRLGAAAEGIETVMRRGYRANGG